MFRAVLMALVTLCFIGTAQAGQCPAPDLEESLLQQKITENPDYLIRKLEGDSVLEFFDNLTRSGLMLGMVTVDRIYIIKSDTRPDSYIIYFVDKGCIVEDGYTPKVIIDRMLPK